jgi:hypothetical protein
MTRKHRDTRPAYQPLADGETFRAPGQTKPVSELIAGKRTVRMWSWRPNR